MQPYSNRSGSSGVVGFHSTPTSIEVRFVDGGTYLYDWTKPGREHVTAMQERAAEGRGLATYINQHVRKAYARKTSGEA
jgi:hypothetical protein